MAPVRQVSPTLRKPPTRPPWPAACWTHLHRSVARAHAAGGTMVAVL